MWESSEIHIMIVLRTETSLEKEKKNKNTKQVIQITSEIKDV